MPDQPTAAHHDGAPIRVAGHRVLAAVPRWAIVLIVLVFVRSEPLQACSCAANDPPPKELLGSTAVFSGRVRDITLSPWRKSEEVAGFEVRLEHVEFEVLDVWKGVTHRFATVTTRESGGRCGYDFVVGREYLVYAHGGSEATLTTSLCTRTCELGDAGEDLAALPPPTSRGAQLLDGFTPGVPRGVLRYWTIENGLWALLVLLVAGVMVGLGLKSKPELDAQAQN